MVFIMSTHHQPPTNIWMNSCWESERYRGWVWDGYVRLRLQNMGQRACHNAIPLPLPLWQSFNNCNTGGLVSCLRLWVAEHICLSAVAQSTTCAPEHGHFSLHLITSFLSDAKVKCPGNPCQHANTSQQHTGCGRSLLFIYIMSIHSHQWNHSWAHTTPSWN